MRTPVRPIARLLLFCLLAVAVSGCAQRHGGGATEVHLQIVPIATDDAVGKQMVARLAEDPGAAAQGLQPATERWYDAQSGNSFESSFLVAPDREPLERFVQGRIADGTLEVPAGEAIVYGPSLNHPGAWRTFHVVESEALIVEEVRGLRQIDNGMGQEALALRLSPADGDAFADLTRRHVGRKLAFLAGDRVEMAPVVHEPITGGRIQLMIRDDADDLIRRLKNE